MKIYTDGYIIPGGKGGGYRLVDESNRLMAHGHTSRKIKSGEAELQGVVQALRVAKRGDVISSDSTNAIGWVQTARSRTRPDLKILYDEGYLLLKTKGVYLIWEARHRNLAGKHNEEFHVKRRASMREEDRAREIARGKQPVATPDNSKWPKRYFAPLKPETRSEAYKPQYEHTREALSKRQAGVPVLSLSIEERIALEVATF